MKPHSPAGEPAGGSLNPAGLAPPLVGAVLWLTIAAARSDHWDLGAPAACAGWSGLPHLGLLDSTAAGDVCGCGSCIRACSPSVKVSSSPAVADSATREANWIPASVATAAAPYRS